MTRYWSVSKWSITGIPMRSWGLPFKELFVPALCLRYEWHGWDGGTELGASVIRTQHRPLVRRLCLCCICTSHFPVREYCDKECQLKRKEKKKKQLANELAQRGLIWVFVMWKRKKKEKKAICMDLEQLDWTLWLITPLWKKYLGKITAEQQ